MTVSDRTRPRRAFRAAASRLGRPGRAPSERANTPAGTPHHLRRLPHVVLGGGEVIHIARTFRARLRGLLGTDALPSGHALLLTDTKAVHMLGMRFAIDCVWLDENGRPIHVDRGVAPGQRRRCSGARSVLEVRAGEGDRFVTLVRAAGVAMITGH